MHSGHGQRDSAAAAARGTAPAPLASRSLRARPAPRRCTTRPYYPRPTFLPCCSALRPCWSCAGPSRAGARRPSRSAPVSTRDVAHTPLATSVAAPGRNRRSTDRRTRPRPVRRSRHCLVHLPLSITSLPSISRLAPPSPTSGTGGGANRRERANATASSSGRSNGLSTSGEQGATAGGLGWLHHGHTPPRSSPPRTRRVGG